MKLIYQLLKTVNHLPLDRFEVKPDGSIFDSWEFLKLGDGDASQFYARAKPGNPELRGKQLRIEVDLLDWQNQDRSKSYVAMAHQLDFTRQSEYVGSISKCDLLIPDESYVFETEAQENIWDGKLDCSFPEDATVSMEICHVQGQSLNATASVKMGWQGKFYVLVRILVDRELMQTLSDDINSGKYERLTTSVSITPWRLIGEKFNNLIPQDRPFPDDEGFDFPKILDTQCSDMFRFTFMPRDQDGRTITILEEQSHQLSNLIELLKRSHRLMLVSLLLMTIITVLLIQL